MVHNCALTRSMGYYLEPLLLLGLFGKKPLSIRLRGNNSSTSDNAKPVSLSLSLCCRLKYDLPFAGVTDDPKDPSVDTFRNASLHILKRFGVPSEGLDLKIEARGVAPEGGGEVLLTVPNVQTLTVCAFFFSFCFLSLFTSLQTLSYLFIFLCLRRSSG